MPVEMLKFLFAVAIPVTCFFGPMALSYAVVSCVKRMQKARKSPLNRDLLRSPGESLRERIEDLNVDLNASFAMVFSFPLLMCALYFSHAYWFGAKANSWVGIVYVLFGAVGTACFVVKVVIAMRKKTRLRLGLECELAMGQELNQLMCRGYRVYHDFPADHFNIDHIVAGPNGVFAVETKGRSKRENHNGCFEYKVAYDGEHLEFPGWTETKPLKQAKCQADWLAQWLTSAVGEAVSVLPVLALPNWFVDGNSQNGLLVLSGKECRSVLSKWVNGHLSEQLIQRIAHQLDQRCRDVAPKAYKQDK